MALSRFWVPGQCAKSKQLRSSVPGSLCLGISCSSCWASKSDDDRDGKPVFALLCFAQPQEPTVSAVLPAPFVSVLLCCCGSESFGLPEWMIEVAVCDTHVEVTVDSRSHLFDFSCLCCLLLHAVFGEESPHRIMVYDPRHSLTGLSCSPEL